MTLLGMYVALAAPGSIQKRYGHLPQPVLRKVGFLLLLLWVSHVGWMPRQGPQDREIDDEHTGAELQMLSFYKKLNVGSK